MKMIGSRQLVSVILNVIIFHLFASECFAKDSHVKDDAPIAKSEKCE